MATTPPYESLADKRARIRREAALKEQPAYADDPFGVAFPDITGQEGSTWEEISDYRKGLRQARAGAVARFIPDRLRGAAQGAAGIFPTGVSWEQESQQRQALIDALRAYENSENELKAQGLRHDYQTRTAEAQELNALGRLLQQGMQSTASASSKNAEVAIRRSLGYMEILKGEIDEQGMRRGKLYGTVNQDVVNSLGPLVAPVAGMGGTRTHEVSPQRAKELLDAVALGMTGDARQDAAFIEQVESQYQLNLGQYFGVQLTKDNKLVPSPGAPGSLGEAVDAVRSSMEGSFIQAQKARARMRQADAQYAVEIDSVFDGLDKAYAGIPKELTSVFTRFKELTNRKKILPNTQMQRTAGGELVPAPTGTPGVEAAPGAETVTTQETQAQTTQEPSRDLFTEQVKAQIEHLDNPNPPGKILQAKNDIKDSALFQAFKRDNQFQTDDVAYRAFMEESRDRTREAKAKDMETLQARRREAEGGEGNLRTRMAEGFSRLRPRYNRRRLAAEAVQQTPVTPGTETETGAKDKNQSLGQGE